MKFGVTRVFCLIEIPTAVIAEDKTMIVQIATAALNLPNVLFLPIFFISSSPIVSLI